MTSPRFWKFVLLLYVIVLGMISAAAYMKRLHIPLFINKWNLDKLIHFVLLGGASFLARRSTPHARGPLFDLPTGPFVVGVLATTDECVQAFSPVRTFSFADMAANLGGVIVFGWLAGTKEPDPLTTKDLS